MQVKLKRQTKEVPTRCSSGFQSFFTCNFPPKRCSFIAKSSVGILCHWNCKPYLSHQAVSDLPVLQTPHVCVHGWVGAVVPRASKTFSSLQSLSHVRLFVTSWTAAYQAPRSMGFFRQEYWSGVPLPSPASILSPIKWDGLRAFCDWKFAHFSFRYFSLHISVDKVLNIYRVKVVVSFCNFECFILMKCFSLPQFLLTRGLFGCY